jgi:mono/diheme cytochrome c family protein
MPRSRPLTGKALASVLASACVIAGAAWADNGGASMSGPASFAEQDGGQLYRMICQGCHMSDAQGAIGAGGYPALANNKRLAAAAYPVYTIIQGRKGMPSLAAYLSNDQVAAVVNYVRSHFGNHYTDSVSPELVRAARATR